MLAASALALSLAVAGCAKNTGSNSNTNTGPQKQAAIEIDKEGKTPTPAPEVPGAKPGGTLSWLEEAAPEHLDPQQAYVSDAQSIMSLFYRTLTNYIEDPKGGPLKLVGDLATNTGESSDGDKKWTYHLRAGVKFEDGSPITSKDVAYGISRSMGKYGVHGPQYWKQALDPDGKFKPDGGAISPAIATPDDKTIVFTFPEAHAETPFIAALNTTTPVPAAKDTGDKYEAEFISMGPYMRDGTYDQQTKLTLKKNPNWDPKTDPIRHQYADKWIFDFTPDRATQTQRLIADQGADQGAIMVANVAQASIAQVQNDPVLSKRTISGVGSFVDYLSINTSRVKDLKVRQAINYAFDRGAYVTAVGGSAVAQPATALMSPTLPGYKKYDAYPSADGHGDDRSTYYDTIGEKTTTCDVMRYGWSADYPDPSSTLNVLWNGKNIVEKGNQNVSYLNEPELNSKLDALQKEPDRAAAADKYGELDKEMMEKYAPVVPNYDIGVFLLRGSKVGGTFLSPLFANANLVDAYYTG
ncbi:MAG: hypothetical protein AUI14_21260 [Actinobacteria bacterium 13_2_20CM_2_71_6]|nr:MAG: hypothetical protein AUI14_21260 [Actinobacteria bacterium 13_2_20CM_2_71_6]